MRSRSGIGTLRPVPNISPDASCLGYWSTVLALKMLRVPSAFGEHAAVEHEAEVMGRRVAEVHRHRLAAVLGVDRAQALVDERERLLPRDLVEAAVRAPQQRRAQAVGVVVQLAERRALRADEAVAEDVVLVAAHARDAVVLDRQLEAAGGLAERAGADGGARGGGHRRNLRLGAARVQPILDVWPPVVS